MPKTVADFKREFAFKKSFKDDPMAALMTLMKGKMGGGFFEQFEEVIMATVIASTRQMLLNKEVLNVLASMIAKKIPPQKIPKDGEPGKTPVKGEDYFTDDEVETIIRMARPMKGKDYFTEEDIKTIARLAKPIAGVDFKLPKDGEPGLSGSPDTGKEIVDKVNVLPPERPYQIGMEHIDGLIKALKNLSSSAGGKEIHRGGVKLVWNTVLEGSVNGSNTIFTLPASQPTPKDNLFIIEARGVIKSADNNDFTTSNNNRTFTFVDPPAEGSNQPRIILYNGK